MVVNAALSERGKEKSLEKVINIPGRNIIGFLPLTLPCTITAMREGIEAKENDPARAC